MKLEGAGATAGAGMGVPALPLLGRCKVASAEPGQDALSAPACSQRQRVGFAPRRTNHSAPRLWSLQWLPLVAAETEIHCEA